MSHSARQVGPHVEQDALSFVVTGTVFMRASEVADDNWTVDGGDDLAEGDRFWEAGKDVAPTDAPLRTDEAGAL